MVSVQCTDLIYYAAIRIWNHLSLILQFFGFLLPSFFLVVFSPLQLQGSLPVAPLFCYKVAGYSQPYVIPILEIAYCRKIPPSPHLFSPIHLFSPKLFLESRSLSRLTPIYISSYPFFLLQTMQFAIHLQ